MAARPLPLPYERGGRWWADFKRLKGGRHPLVPKGQTQGLDVLGPAHTKHEREQNMLEAIALLHRDWDAKASEIARVRAGISAAQAGIARPLFDRYITWKTRSTNENVRVSAKELQGIRRGCGRIFALECARSWTSISEFNTGAAIEMIVDALRDQKLPDKRRYAEATIRGWCMAFSGLVTYAVGRGLVAQNLWYSSPHLPSGRVLDEKGRHIPQHFLTPDEIRSVLEVADAKAKAGLSYRNPYLRDITYVLAYTGARREEVLRLQLGHVDFRQYLIRIPGTKHGEKTRTLPLHAPLRRILLRYRKCRQPADLLFPSVAKPKGKNAAEESARRLAGPQPMLGVAKGLKQLMREAGIAPMKFLSPSELRAEGHDVELGTASSERRARAACHHIWRHSYAMVRLGMVRPVGRGRPAAVSEHDVAAELGHSNETQIRDTYANRPDRVEWPVVELDYQHAPRTSPAVTTPKNRPGSRQKGGATRQKSRAARESRDAPSSSSARRHSRLSKAQRGQTSRPR